MKTQTTLLKAIILFVLFFMNKFSSAQNVGINSTGALPNATALLDVNAAPGNNKGILIPRIALTQTTLNAPVGVGVVTSLLVYNTATINDVTPGYYYWDGTKWVSFTGSNSNDWALLGNAGTTAGTNFLGTTDAKDLVIKTNATEWMRVTSTGHVGVGTSTPSTDGAVHINSTVANSTKWSTSNYGANLIIGGPGGSRNPAVAFLDFAGGNPYAICNAGNLVITRMPPLNNGVVQQSYDLNIFSSDGHTELGVLAGGNPAFYRDLVVSGRTGLFVNPINTLDVNGGTAMGSYAGINAAPVNGAIISGNVGIGTTAPLEKLHINGAAPAIMVEDNTFPGNVALLQANNTFIGPSLVSHTNSSNLSTFNTPANRIEFGNAGIIFRNSPATAIGVARVFTAAAIITNAGDVGIGTLAPNAKLNVMGEVNFTNGAGSVLWSNVAQRDFDVLQSNTSTNRAFTVHSGSSSGSAFFNIAVDFYGNDGLGNNLPGFTMLKNCNVGIGTTAPTQALHVVGNICYTGGIGACSDVRYKKDFTPLANSLEKVLKINGLNYFWKTEEFPDQKFTSDKQIGFIAQDLEKIYPELVTTDKNGYKSVDYSRLTPILVEAMKEQQKIIESQQAVISNLKAENKNTNAQILQHENRLKLLEEILNTSAKK